jgi:hypothetical protein
MRDSAPESLEISSAVRSRSASGVPNLSTCYLSNRYQRGQKDPELPSTIAHDGEGLDLGTACHASTAPLVLPSSQITTINGANRCDVRSLSFSCCA